jgi:hypothetical protein
LGIEPDRAFAKGDAHEVRGRRLLRPTGVWAVDSSSHVSSHELAEHAKYILRLLEPAREAINEVREGTSLRVRISIWWEPEGGQGGYTLKAKTVAALCEYCDEIDFYFA